MWAGTRPTLTIKPRTHGYKHMRLAVVYEHRIYDEDYAITTDWEGYVKAAPPTVFVTTDPSVFLHRLDYWYCEHPHWRFNLSRNVQDKGELGAMSRVRLTTFGFRPCDKPKERAACPICSEQKGARKGRLHQCWDPRAMSPTPIHKFIDGPLTPAALLTWATDVRAWAREQNLGLRASLSGYSAQLLRDPRFYPAPRRRVPRATNDRARPHMPGNLVRLTDVEPGPQHYNVTSVDQRSAHHRVVQEIALPNADTLYARGYFNDPEGASKYWAPRNSEAFNRIMSQPGLVYVGMTTRRTGKGEFRFQVQDDTGYKRAYIWTNTFTALEATGTHIEGIYAAWTSTTTDAGLPQYGKWAATQVETASPERKLWLKPLLHSTYGLLAARARPLETGGNRRKGKSSSFLIGPRVFQVNSRTVSRHAPAFVNVIQRGMIEAETQRRSLELAQELTNAGCRVLHIHTDGLHVQGPLPLLPDTWAVKGLTDVMYLDDVSWVALERDCLPGRDQRQRVEVIRHYAGLHRTLSGQRHNG